MTGLAGSDVTLRTRCRGVAPLDARLERWQREACARPDELARAMDLHGSPINLINPAPMGRNAAELQEPARAAGLDLGIYFARKANKALGLVDEARRLGLGVDLASERELAQVLGRGVPGTALVMTAAVKPVRLLQACIASATTIVVDNADELRLVGQIAEQMAATASIAIRLAPDLGADRRPTRFGMPIDHVLHLVNGAPAATEGPPAAADPGGGGSVRITGVHFHLDGYSADDRVTAIDQALVLVDALRGGGHHPTFLDIGGGVPMSYLDDGAQWARFWTDHHAGLLGQRDPLTFEGHPLGLQVHDGVVSGRPALYPYHQQPTRGEWLAQVLAASLPGTATTVAQGIAQRGLQLRCEPGRSLLDGCGMTAARVAFRKQRTDGTWLIGVEMNRTQCRSTSDDFLVDPILVRPDHPDRRGPATGPMEGYLVGAYCIERELLTWRRLRFPTGVQVGDIVVFPNTAGYLMHILESSSHQIPLARNLLVQSDGSILLDPIDDHSEASIPG